MHSYQRFVLKTVHKFHKTLKTNVYCGERGIRTPGTGKSVRQFSKLLVSATHPSHQTGRFCNNFLKIHGTDIKKGRQKSSSTGFT